MDQFLPDFKICVPRNVSGKIAGSEVVNATYVGVCATCLSGYDRNDPFRSPGIKCKETLGGWFRCFSCDNADTVHWWMAQVFVTICDRGSVEFDDYFKIMDCLVNKSVTNGDVIGYSSYGDYLNSCVKNKEFNYGYLGPVEIIKEIVDRPCDQFKIDEKYGSAVVTSCSGGEGEKYFNSNNLEVMTVYHEPKYMNFKEGFIALYPCIPVSGSMGSVFPVLSEISKYKVEVHSYDSMKMRYNVDLIGDYRDGDSFDIHYYYMSSSGQLYKLNSETYVHIGSKKNRLEGFNFKIDSADNDYLRKQLINDYSLGNYGLILLEINYDFKANKRFTCKIGQEASYAVVRHDYVDCLPRDLLGGYDNLAAIRYRLSLLYTKSMLFARIFKVRSPVWPVGVGDHPKTKFHDWHWFYEKYNDMIKRGKVIGGDYVIGETYMGLMDYLCSYCSRIRRGHRTASECASCLCNETVNKPALVVYIYKLLLSNALMLTGDKFSNDNLSWLCDHLETMINSGEFETLIPIDHMLYNYLGTFLEKNRIQYLQASDSIDEFDDRFIIMHTDIEEMLQNVAGEHDIIFG